MPEIKKVLTSNGRVIQLPFVNSELDKEEEIIATDADGGFLGTSDETDFTWDSLSNFVESGDKCSPLQVNTFTDQLNHYKNILADSIQKIEFLEKLIGEEYNQS